jgi:hypothetical protein
MVVAGAIQGSAQLNGRKLARKQTQGPEGRRSFRARYLPARYPLRNCHYRQNFTSTRTVNDQLDLGKAHADDNYVVGTTFANTDAGLGSAISSMLLAPGTIVSRFQRAARRTAGRVCPTFVRPQRRGRLTAESRQRLRLGRTGDPDGHRRTRSL